MSVKHLCNHWCAIVLSYLPSLPFPHPSTAVKYVMCLHEYPSHFWPFLLVLFVKTEMISSHQILAPPVEMLPILQGLTVVLIFFCEAQPLKIRTDCGREKIHDMKYETR